MNILTGFSHLDDIMGELRPGELTFIAGRPCMGKTTLCWSIADNIKRSGKQVRVVAVRYGYIGTDNPFGIDTYMTVPFDEFDSATHINPRTGGKYDVLRSCIQRIKKSQY